MKTCQNHCIFLVRWDGGARDTYLYGSDLVWDSDGTIRFENWYLPSGEAIKTWSSARSWQRDRGEAQLPVLEEGKTYLLRSFFLDDPEGTVLVRLRFFDRYGGQCGFYVSEQKEDRFVCPEGTFAWKMELLWAGARTLVFDHVEVEEAPEEESLPCPEEDRPSTTLCLVVPEGGRRMIRLPVLPEPLSGLRAEFLPTAFLAPEPVRDKETSLDAKTAGYRKVVIVTYGEKSQKAGEEIAAAIPGAQHRAFDGIGRMQEFLSGREV